MLDDLRESSLANTSSNDDGNNNDNGNDDNGYSNGSNKDSNDSNKDSNEDESKKDYNNGSNKDYNTTSYDDEIYPLVLTISVIKSNDKNRQEKRKKSNKNNSKKDINNNVFLISNLVFSLECSNLSLYMNNNDNNNENNNEKNNESNSENNNENINNNTEKNDNKDNNKNENLKDELNTRSLKNDNSSPSNLSNITYQEDFSTILMTCSALTSRAFGHFFITRNKVEFSISCLEKIGKVVRSDFKHENLDKCSKPVNVESYRWLSLCIFNYVVLL